MEHFAIDYGPDRLAVSSTIPGVLEMTRRLVSPAFAVTEGEAQNAGWSIDVEEVSSEALSELEASARKGCARLVLTEGETEYVITESSRSRTTLLKLAAGDDPAFVVESRRDESRWRVLLAPFQKRGVRAVTRLAKLYFGALSQSRGRVFVHASAVVVDGVTILFSGNGGSGKSSLAYLTCARLGARFLSDDMVVAQYRDDDGVQVTGWPKRIALGLSLLRDEPAFARVQSTPLRRHGSDYSLPEGRPDAAWTRANRVAFDPDEYVDLFGFSAESTGRPALLVLPHGNPEMEGWRTERVTLAPDAMASALLANRVHLKFMTDYAGITPYDRPVVEPALVGALCQLPVVRTSFGPAAGAHFRDFFAEILRAAQG